MSGSRPRAAGPMVRSAPMTGSYAARSSPAGTSSSTRATAMSVWWTLRSSRARWPPRWLPRWAWRSTTWPGRRRRRAVPASSEHEVVHAQVTLPEDVDLHARPAASFVRAAMRFSAHVTVATDSKQADAKSLLSVLALGARRGTSLRLRAEGEDAAAASAALATVVAE